LTRAGLCLGIESTAHTFSIGIVDFDGKILAVVNDTYVPDTGGLHPRKVVEHHTNVFMEVLNAALAESQVKLEDISLISFSQGPGLGPCLRIGAALARSLSQKLKIPIVGVNHCIAHIEIGRLICNVFDPLTLYVSGGNTIVSAFETGKYQIFGETLDIAAGNLIDMVARELGLPHPGGPKIEKMAATEQTYIPLPYVVKGMDLSFSGMYTTCRNLIHSENYKNKYSAEQIAYSLQETSFAMLAEVTERALAHTEKSEVLLTGGVAANKRLQQMIKYIAEQHSSRFNVVPLKLAGDNGAMIAWTGILQLKNRGGMKLPDTIIQPKWRMDSVPVPWREENSKFTGLSPSEKIHKNYNSNPNTNPNPNCNSDNTLMKQEILKMGAEAVITRDIINDTDVIVKKRILKAYRIPEIDQIVRSQRCLNESRAIIRCKEYEVPVPVIYNVDSQLCSITMSYIDGPRLKDAIRNLSEHEIKEIFYEIGIFVAKLHKNNQIHGDLTTSNIILTPKRNIFFIDFGLTFSSTTIEDKAIDLHLLKRVITSTHGSYYENMFPMFCQGYISELGLEGKSIIEKIGEIETRGRYIQKINRKRT
jgi:N6-L-threonylcarbamoyladenine synthase/protein kinase Bud32